METILIKRVFDDLNRDVAKKVQNNCMIVEVVNALKLARTLF